MTENGSPLDEVPDKELVEALMNQFHAQELRKWMSANGLTRSHGANKSKSARQAIEQDREGIARFLLERNAIEVDWQPRCMYYKACGNHTTGHREDMCTDCVDVLRWNSSKQTIDLDNFDSIVDYMTELHVRFG